jgi:hypothetical protein
LDTLDNAIQLAEQESIRLWNKENPQKRTTAINAAWGGYMKGQDKAMELLQEQLFRLREVGVAFSVIGHVRQTTITDPITNESYQQITSDVSQRYFNQLKKNIDLIGIAYIDREIVKNKAKGKEVVFVANIPAAAANELDGENFWRVLHMDDINAIYKAAAQKSGFPLISMYDLFTKYCESNSITVDSLLCDGLHPNDQGYDVMYDLICKELRLFGI